jgi:hypothetical protein
MMTTIERAGGAEILGRIIRWEQALVALAKRRCGAEGGEDLARFSERGNRFGLMPQRDQTAPLPQG